MEINPELTSRQLYALFNTKFSAPVSLSTVQRACRALGWGAERTRYCALICEVNKEKRMTWCLEQIAEGDPTSYGLMSAQKIAYQKEGHPVRLAAKPKHPPKIHVWAASGATPIVICTGTLIATRYTRILDAALLPFLERHYPDGHRLQQDNDPKHTSRWAQSYFQQRKRSPNIFDWI